MKPLKILTNLLIAIISYAIVFVFVGFICDLLQLRNLYNIILFPYSIIMELGINGWHIYYFCLAILIISDIVLFFEMDFFNKFLKYGLPKEYEKRVTLFCIIGFIMILLLLFIGYIAAF